MVQNQNNKWIPHKMFTLHSTIPSDDTDGPQEEQFGGRSILHEKFSRTQDPQTHQCSDTCGHILLVLLVHEQQPERYPGIRYSMI